jgi:hypothetical protein
MERQKVLHKLKFYLFSSRNILSLYKHGSTENKIVQVFFYNTAGCYCLLLREENAFYNSIKVSPGQLAHESMTQICSKTVNTKKLTD